MIRIYDTLNRYISSSNENEDSDHYKQIVYKSLERSQWSSPFLLAGVQGEVAHAPENKSKE